MVGRLLMRPVGLELDLNGVVKGQTVDEAVGLLSGDGFVAAGGDYAGHGEFDVALPGGDSVRVTHGGLATSGTTKRRWLRAGVWQHHLIDPGSGRPAESPWTEVTVSAGTCLQADVAAKAAFLLGPDGPAWLDGARPRGTVPARGRPACSQSRVAALRARSGGGVILGAFAVDWYAARAAGVVAYLLVSASVALGLALAGKERFDRWPRFAVEDVHRFAGVLAGTFIALHIFWLAVDSQAHLEVSGLLVPFTSSYRPLWTGLGIVAAELLLALAVTNHYRKRISYSLWRRLHYLNFAVWIAATVHGLGAGSDSGSPAFLLMYASTIGILGVLALRRIVPKPVVSPGTPTAASAGTRSRRTRA